MNERTRKTRRWRLREAPVVDGPAHTPYPPLIRRLLALRGITSASDANAFLDGASVGDALDPLTLPDAELAVERLAAAARAGETVAIFGDFDVDGVTATVILTETLQSLGAKPVPYIPDRFSEGYGLNVPAIDRLHDAGATLLVAVDCGTGAPNEVAHAQSLGFDVIVVDHHLSLTPLTSKLPLVNPKAAGETVGAELASAGLAYHLATALYGRLNRPFPVERYLDLAALGTVVDIAPLTGANRDLVRRGLDAIARTERPGLRALLEVARIGAVDTESLSFGLGPRLNAPGRIAHARLSLELLTCRDPKDAWELAKKVDSLNGERQRQQQTAVDLAWSLLDGDGTAARDAPLVMLGDAAIPAGVAGLVASKLAEELYRPCVVYSCDGDRSRASARSIPEFDIAVAFGGCCHLFERFGGHHQAAGFTALNERLPEIKSRLLAHAEEQLRDVDLTPVIDVDAELPLREIGRAEIPWLQRFGPHGEGNPLPVFLSRGARVLERREMGADGRHLWLKLRDGAVVWPAIGFRMGDVEAAETVDIVYSVTPDQRADSLRLLLHDIRPSL